MNPKDFGNSEIHTEIINHDLQEGTDNSNGLFNSQKRIYSINGGIVTDEHNVLHQIDCGHTIKTTQELLGRCQVCNTRYVCFRCGVRCSQCFKLLCTNCLKQYESAAYCRSCKVVALIFKGSMFGLRKVHELLSKKI